MSSKCAPNRDKIAILLSKVVTLTWLAAILSGCESSGVAPVIDPSATRCTAGEAQIGVGDGYLQTLCGCTGSVDGAILSQPANLVCHVPAGTVVYFQYLATHLDHQIVSSGGLSFPSSAPSIPGRSDTIYTHAFTVQSSGTYDFEDAFNLALQGQIIAP